MGCTASAAVGVSPPLWSIAVHCPGPAGEDACSVLASDLDLPAKLPLARLRWHVFRALAADDALGADVRKRVQAFVFQWPVRTRSAHPGPTLEDVAVAHEASIDLAQLLRAQSGLLQLRVRIVPAGEGGAGENGAPQRGTDPAAGGIAGKLAVAVAQLSQHTSSADAPSALAAGTSAVMGFVEAVPDAVGLLGEAAAEVGFEDVLDRLKDGCALLAGAVRFVGDVTCSVPFVGVATKLVATAATMLSEVRRVWACCLSRTWRALALPAC